MFLACPITMQQIMQSKMSSFSSCDTRLMPLCSTILWLLAVISLMNVPRIFLSRLTFSWTLHSLESSIMPLVVSGSWFSSWLRSRQCQFTLSCLTSNSRLMPYSFQEILPLPLMSFRRTAWQISLQSGRALMMWWAVSSKIRERVSTFLELRMERQPLKQNCETLAIRLRHFSYSSTNCSWLVKWWLRRQRPQMAVREKRRGFFLHSLTISASISWKDLNLRDSSRYLRRESLYCSLGLSQFSPAFRNSLKVPRTPTSSFQQMASSACVMYSIRLQQLMRLAVGWWVSSMERLSVENSISQKGLEWVLLLLSLQDWALVRVVRLFCPNMELFCINQFIRKQNKITRKSCYLDISKFCLPLAPTRYRLQPPSRGIAFGNGGQNSRECGHMIGTQFIVDQQAYSLIIICLYGVSLIILVYLFRILLYEQQKSTFGSLFEPRIYNPQARVGLIV